MNPGIRMIGIALLILVLTLGLAACGGPATLTPRPASSSDNTVVPAATAIAPVAVPATAAPAAAFEAKHNAGGGVTVDVKPSALGPGIRAEFDVALNTHSVDLSDDMARISFLRDDAGTVYTPDAWEGSQPGGHHRSGTLKFAVLNGKPHYVELVIQGMAEVPERIFKWDLQ